MGEDVTKDGAGMTPRRGVEAAAWGAPVGVLGGLIGLGGGEFRIPILMRRFGLAPRAVVPVNATISMFTLASSLAFRGATLSWDALPGHAFDIAMLALGGVLAALSAMRCKRRSCGCSLRSGSC